MAAVLMLLLACGGGKPKPAVVVVTDAGVGDAAAPADDAAAVEEVELSTRSEDGIAAAGAAFAYIHAVSVRDWSGACALLRAKEKAKLAAGGSCPRGLERQFDAARITALATAATDGVRKKGKTMAVDITVPNQPKPIMTVYLQREDRLWLLVDVPDSEAF